MKKLYFSIALIFTLGLVHCDKKVKTEGQSPNFGKPRAPVTLTYTSYKWLNTGEQATITYHGSPQTNAEDLVVSVNLPNGLNYISGDTSVSSGGPLNAGDNIGGAVTVQANAEGLYYIGLAGQIRFSGQTQTNNIAIPVQYGTAEPELKNVGKITTSTQKGTNVHGQKTSTTKTYHEIAVE